MIGRIPRLLLVLGLLGVLTPTVNAAEPTEGRVIVAAAANLVPVLEALNAGFRRQHPAVELTVTTGASGSIVSQIRNGAPYEVFLSADLDYPRALVAAGQAEADTLVSFAAGQLVLWTIRPALDLGSLEAALRDPALRRLAVANPDTAPYGRAARQVLVGMDLWESPATRIVTGDNVSQTAQFVQTGNVDAGFVALSIVLSPDLRGVGRWIAVPESLHEPLDQGAILTTRGRDNPAARLYLDYLVSPAARQILQDAGYGPPGEGAPAAAPQ